MASSRLHLFCSSEELTKILVLLATKYQLEIVYFSRNKEHSDVYSPANFPGFHDPCFCIFLCPANTPPQRKKHSEKINSDWGWIEITAGRQETLDHQNVLALTAFYVEDPRKNSESLVKCIRWLKRDYIKKHATYGVFGFIGGHAEKQTELSQTPSGQNNAPMTYYKDIAYTQGAHYLLKQGYIWKQNASFKSTFIPKEERR